MASNDILQARIDAISPTLRDTSAASKGVYYIQNTYSVTCNDSTTGAANPVLTNIPRHTITLGP